MRLSTLGGLSWPGVSFNRPKPLLLLVYLALEGPHTRRDLAGLFWPDSPDPLVNLRVTLRLLRGLDAGCLVEEGGLLRAAVTTDVAQVLVAASRDDLAALETLYRGRFLPEIVAEGELEEWIYTTREQVAGAVRAAYLRGALRASGPQVAAQLAEQALTVAGAGPPEPEELVRLYPLLTRVTHPRAADVRRAAADYGLVLGRAPDQGTATPLSPLPPPEVLIGRDREQSEISALLRVAPGRLVTLTGPGGIGKSRLAAGVGWAAREAGQRVLWVALETLPGPALLPGRICDALGLAPPLSSDAPAHVLRALATEPTLLVLDNAEHLLSPDGEFVGLVQGLLCALPDLRVLVTSREALGTGSEQLYPLEGLSWQGDGSALALFEHQARRVQPSFTVTPQLLGPVRRICELLDGSPLGIELAATWIRTLSLQELASELGRSLLVLEAAPQRAGRHSTLRTVFDQSWARLDGTQQTVLRRLTVFNGGFTRRAAAVVAGAALPVLATLVDRSLLRLSSAGRYHMHPLVAEYAAEYLAAHPAEQATAQAAHARFFVALAEEAAPELYGPEQEEWFVRLADDQANLRQASGWGLAHGEPDLVARLQRALWIFVYCREDHRWGQAQLVQALRHPQISPAGQATLCWAVGGLSRLAGHHEAAATMLDSAVALARREGLRDIELLALIHRGLLAYTQGDLEAAQRDLRACLHLAPQLNNPALEVYTYSHLGEHFSRHGNFREAEPLLHFAARQARNLAGSWQTAKASMQLAQHLHHSGQLQAAEQEFLGCLGLLEHLSPTAQLPQCLVAYAALQADMNDDVGAQATVDRAQALLRGNPATPPEVTGLAQQVLTVLSLRRGHLLDAEHHLRRAAEAFQQADLRPQQLFLLPVLAQLLLAQGQGDFAARLLGTAEQLSRQWQVVLSVPLQQRVADLKARLGPLASPEHVTQVAEPGRLLHTWAQGHS